MVEHYLSSMTIPFLKITIDRRRLQFFSLAALVLLALYGLSYINYLLFHAIAELFSIAIGFGLFMFAWTTREIDENEHLVRIGIAYLFVAFLDLMHTLSYTGMQIFTDYDFYANQLWVAARGMEALTLLFYAASLPRHIKISHRLLFGIYTILTALALYTIYIAKVFPICFIPGQGQTPFKFWAEIVIMAILALSMMILGRNRRFISPVIYRWVQVSILLTIIGEIAFTIYISNYGISNMVGHYMKIISFYLIYKAIIETGLRHPLELLFGRLKYREGELEEANRAKDTLFSIIAHDLKGPIGAMTNLTRLLIEELPGMEREEQLQLLKQMYRSSKQSLELLEDLLDWARTQTGQMEVVPICFYPRELAASVLQTLQVSAEQKGISLEMMIQEDGTAQAYGDAKMAATVLRNLVSNSIKFTPRGGKVTLSAYPSPEGRNILFLVQDTGMGIKEKDMDKLFRPDLLFTSPGTENEAGTGFGLLLSRELAERNNGRLEVASEEGRGTAITFSLPACQETA